MINKSIISNPEYHNELFSPLKTSIIEVNENEFDSNEKNEENNHMVID